MTCSAAPATLQNYTATAVESKRGIKNNSTELIGDTPMVRGRPNEVAKVNSLRTVRIWRMFCAGVLEQGE